MVKVITVSRSYGSGGTDFSRRLADRLGCEYVDGAFLREVEKNLGQSSSLLASIEDEVAEGFLDKLASLMNNRSFYKTALSLCLYELALGRDIVVVGAGGHFVFEGYRPLISLQIVRRLSERVRAVAHDENLGIEEALELIEYKDREKSKFVENYFDKGLFDPLTFHLVLNFSLIPIDKAVTMVSELSQDFLGHVDPSKSEMWLRDRLLEKKAEMVLFHLGLTHGPTVKFEADQGRLMAKGVLGGKHEKEQLLEALAKMSEVTSVADDLKVGVLSRMLY